MATLPGKKTKTMPVEAPVETPVETPVEAPVEAPIPVASTVETPVTIDPTAPVRVSAEEVKARGDTIQPSSVIKDDNAPVSLSKEEVEARTQSELDPWDRKDEYKPTVWSRGWQHLTGIDRPPDEYNIERIGASTTASIAGAYLGARTPPIHPLINPATGALLFSAVGAAAGTYAPEKTLELLEFFHYLPKGYREKHGFSPSRLKYEAQNEFFLDALLGGAISAAKLLWRQTSKFVTGVDEAGKETAKKAKKMFDIDLMPVQVGNRKVAKTFVNVMGRFPWVGSRLVSLGGVASRKLAKSYETLGDKAFKEGTGGVTAANRISKFIFDDAKLLLKDFNADFKKYYDELWKHADKIGVSVRPTYLKKEADDLIAELNQKVTSKVDGTGGEGPIYAEVREWVEKEVRGLTDKQTLKQMDGFLNNLDQFLAKMDHKAQPHAEVLMLKLRQAAINDVTDNAIGEKALKITARLRRIDEEYSYTLNALFETATAKNIEMVTTGGLRRTTKLSTTNTRQHVDQLAKVMINLNSPQSVRELHQLVSKDTFQKIMATTLDDAVEHAKKINRDGTEEYFSSRFAKYLGLDSARVKDRTEAISEMLRLSGSLIKVDDLQTIIKITKTIEGLPLPNASTFLQRKAVLGSVKGVLTGALPGLAASAGTGLFTGIWGIALMLGGSKLAMRIITDKNTLKPAMEVLKTNKYSIPNWQLAPKILRLALSASLGEGSITQEQFKELSKMVEPLVDGFKQEVDEQEIYPLFPLLKSDKTKKKIADREKREAVLNETPNNE